MYFGRSPWFGHADGKGALGGHPASPRSGRSDLARGVALAMQDPDLGYLQVQTLDPDHPSTKSALDYQRLHPGKAVRLRDRVFGDMGIDEVYIDPAPAPVSSMNP